jgi:hypothetical protein
MAHVSICKVKSPAARIVSMFQAETFSTALYRFICATLLIIIVDEIVEQEE